MNLTSETIKVSRRRAQGLAGGLAAQASASGPGADPLRT